METTRAPGGATRSSLSEQVRVNLVEKINNGRLLPGDRIVEARVAEELHVSSIPVREAIRGLVAERILEYNVHKGVRVRQVSMAETVDALRVKAVLEGLAARLAGPRLKGRWSGCAARWPPSWSRCTGQTSSSSRSRTSSSTAPSWRLPATRS